MKEGRTYTLKRPLKRRTQDGMSAYGWMMTIAAIAFFAISALKLAPHYIDFGMVTGVLDRLPEPGTHAMTRAEIREHFDRQFRVENFEPTVRDVVIIDRDGDQTRVAVSYEIREPLIYNIDAVLKFEEERIFK